ncbi:response regulator [Oceanobacter sp. 3_MG-2023]|uniref:response regulator n=1 Tax=Oceanobacter sp. 3_MG-2023 TaxID=3062622 RepID=UPI0027324810|nr:response regulator [Oceanobacter sp. 3_MG-2023]MDP2506421.1 hypothetical protein [Oceanobacter sp. 3_MG-2023]
MTFKVLLVGNAAGILHSISRLLLSEHIAVQTTTGTAEALDYLASYPVHVLIIDSQTPELDELSLCQQARQISPGSYRILLTNQLDSARLRQARQQGAIHKLIATPWNNLVLIRDIIEGARQANLMQQAHSLQSALNTQQPVLLTDRNWVIRLANQPICDALQVNEEQLLGRNLFTGTISHMPVALEAEITRQTEANQTWLGYFNLIVQQRRIQPTWMAITSISDDFRLCICSLLDSVTERHTNPDSDTQRYAGLHQLNQMESYLTQSDGITCILLISFDPDQVFDTGLSRLCYERIAEATTSPSPIFQPAHHLFLVPVIADPANPCTQGLCQAIAQGFRQPLSHQGQAVMLSPDINCSWGQSTQHTPDAATSLKHIRQHLGLEGPDTPSLEQVQPYKSALSATTLPTQQRQQSDFHATPIFDSQGALAGLELLPEYMAKPDLCHRWLEDMHITWQQHFLQPMYVILRVADLTDHCRQHLTSCLAAWPQQAGKPAPVWCIVLPWTPEEPTPRLEEALRQLDIRLIFEITDPQHQQRLPGYQSLSAMDVDGFSLPPCMISHARQALHQGQPLLQRLQQDGLIIYAHGIDSTEALAAAHQSGIDWMSGDALSRKVNAAQLYWFAIND